MKEQQTHSRALSRRDRSVAANGTTAAHGMTLTTKPPKPVGNQHRQRPDQLSGHAKPSTPAFASPAITGKAIGRGVTKRLENVYYYNATSACGRAAWRSGCGATAGYVQTLKSNDTKGWLAIAAVGSPSPSSKPDIGVLPAGALEVLDGLVPPTSLKPVHHPLAAPGTADRPVDRDGRESLIEAALDSGTIESHGDR